MCSERAWKMITTKRLFVYGAGALILSLSCMLIGSMLGYRNVLYHSWLGFSAYIVFAVLISFIAISRRYSRDERRLVFLCLLFGLWYVVTSVFVDQTMLALMTPLYDWPCDSDHLVALCSGHGGINENCCGQAIIAVGVIRQNVIR